MKKKAIYLGVGLLAIPVAVLWMFSRDEHSPENAVQNQKQSTQVSSAPKSSAKTIKVSGIGKIKYDRVEEGVDFREFCDELIPDEPFLKNVVLKVDVYLKGDKIVHISKDKGKYKTEDFTNRALKVAQRGEPETGWGSRGCETLTHQESWLSIRDREKLAGIWMYMKGSGWDSLHYEGEITPVHIRHNQDYNGDPANIGKIFPALLFRTCSGLTSGEEAQHPVYPREDTYYRRWNLVALMQGKDGTWFRNHDVGASVSFSEASLEAIEKWKPVFEERRRKKREAKKRSQAKSE